MQIQGDYGRGASAALAQQARAEPVDRFEVDMAVREARANLPINGSGLADVLRNPNLNATEKDLVIQELARDEAGLSAFYANDAGRIDDPSLGRDQAEIARAVQHAYENGALSADDLVRIADFNGVGNGAQRFLQVLQHDVNARGPGGAAEALADKLWDRNDAGRHDRAVAAMVYASSPELASRNLTSPEMRAQAFEAVVEFNEKAPFDDLPGVVSDSWRNQGLATAGRLFNRYSTELIDRYTDSTAAGSANTETLAKFMSQTVFNPDAENIALDRRQDLIPAIRARLEDAGDTFLDRARAAPAGSVERSRAVEQFGQLTAAVSGGSGLAVNRHADELRENKEAREQMAELIGAVAGDLVGAAKLNGGNTVGTITKSIAEAILDRADGDDPPKPDFAVSGELFDQFDTAVDVLRTELGEPELQSAFRSAYSAEVLNLESNLQVSLAAPNG